MGVNFPWKSDRSLYCAAASGVALVGSNAILLSHLLWVASFGLVGFL